MNLRDELAKPRSKRQVALVVHYVGNDAERFAELIEILKSDNEKICISAAWSMSHVLDENIELAYSQLSTLIQRMQDNTHISVRRCVLRAFQSMEFPSEYLGEITDLCYKYFTSQDQPAAIRIFAMTVLYNISLTIPELQHELVVLIEDRIEFESAGYQSRGKKILKDLQKRLRLD